MEVMLTEQESAALQKALRSYISDLGPEISQTDNARFRQGLKDGDHRALQRRHRLV